MIPTPSFYGKTNNDRSLRKLIGNRIKNFTKIGNHIEFARNNPVNDVGYARQPDKPDCDVIASKPVRPHDKRNQSNPEKAQYIRYRNYPPH